MLLTCKSCKHHHEYDFFDDITHTCDNFYSGFTERIIKNYPETPDWCRLKRKQKGELNARRK